MLNANCTFVTTLFYLFIIQLPVSIDELKQRLVEVWQDLQQNIIDSAIGVGAQSTLGARYFCWNICMKNLQNAQSLHDICPK